MYFRRKFSIAGDNGPLDYKIARTDGSSADPAANPLFTFDLPKQLFDFYADEGILSRRSAVDLKAEYLGEFTAIYAPDAVDRGLLAARLAVVSRSLPGIHQHA